MMPQIQMPNFAATIASGRQVYEQQQEAERANALRGFLQQNGAAIMQGDQNALAGLARIDPDAAMAVQGRQLDMESSRLGMDAQRLGMDATRQDMAGSAERLEMARQEGARRAQEFAANLSAGEAAAKAEEGRKIAAQATLAWQKGPDAWEKWNDQFPDYENIPHDAAPMAIAGITGSIEGFAAAAPLSPEGKRAADARAGLIPDGQSGYRPATPEEAARYGAQAGQFGPDGKFDPINPPSGMTVESDGAGGFSLTQGPGITGKPLNEGQSKNVIYATRAEGALPVLDQMGPALTSRIETIAENVPLGMGKSVQSSEFQQAQQAGNEFLISLLRKDTGAAVTPSEQESYGTVYLPRPGDGPEVLAQKQASRARAVEALRRGMTPSEILALEKPMTAAETGGTPKSGVASTQIRSVEEYNSLPPGTVYTDPNGNTRTKR